MIQPQIPAAPVEERAGNKVERVEVPVDFVTFRMSPRRLAIHWWNPEIHRSKSEQHHGGQGVGGQCQGATDRPPILPAAGLAVPEVDEPAQRCGEAAQVDHVSDEEVLVAQEADLRRQEHEQGHRHQHNPDDDRVDPAMPGGTGRGGPVLHEFDVGEKLPAAVAVCLASERRAQLAVEQPQVLRQHVVADQSMHVEEQEDQRGQCVGGDHRNLDADLREIDEGASQQHLIRGRDHRRHQVDGDAQHEQPASLRRPRAVVDRRDQARDVGRRLEPGHRPLAHDPFPLCGDRFNLCRRRLFVQRVQQAALTLPPARAPPSPARGRGTEGEGRCLRCSSESSAPC